jgi:hypothetical protein
VCLHPVEKEEEKKRDKIQYRHCYVGFYVGWICVRQLSSKKKKKWYDRGWIRPGPEAFSGFGSDPDPDPLGLGRTREYPDPDPNPSGLGRTRVSTWELVLDCWFAR